MDVPLTDDEKKILENSGGYAPDLVKTIKRQKNLSQKHLIQISLSRALILEKSSNISSEDILSMKSGSIILDMALNMEEIHHSHNQIPK